MSRKRIAAAAAVWATVVVVVGALTWVAVDRAGRAVLVEPRAGALVGPAATRTTRSVAPVPQPSATSPSATSAPTSRTRPPTAGPTRSPSGARPTTRPQPRRPASPTPTAPSPSTQPQRPAPADVDRSVRVSGGVVGVRCVGSEVSLRFATPADGWRVEVERRGPDQVTVRFQAAGGREAESEVEAECEDGTPAFSTSGQGESADR